MPFAEHTGLIGPLTRYILNKALAQARAWCEQGRPLTVAVNLSARNLLDEHLPDQVAELLAAHDVAPELLVFEVTETAVVTEPVRAQQLLKRLARWASASPSTTSVPATPVSASSRRCRSASSRSIGRS